MDERERKDEALAKLMRAARAEPDPVLWTRVRARLETGDETRGVIGWLMRPAALAASVATLALASALSVALLRDSLPASYANAGSMTEALLDLQQSPLDALELPPDGTGGTLADTGVTS